MLKFELPKLKYDFNALEPYIDAQTVEIHYTKHHQLYLDKLNLNLDKHPELADRELITLLRDLPSVPEDIRLAVKNFGGGFYNHNLYWDTMIKGGTRSTIIESEILKQWGSLEIFKQEFTEKATTLFGSGWIWLTKNLENKLLITQVPNQDIPEGKHLLAIDVWEHAYYLKYQNRRADYIEAWWNIIDWITVENLYSRRG